MMIRYCRQREVSTCGPTAIINLAKFLGHSNSYKSDIKRLKKLMRWTHRHGVRRTNLDAFMDANFNWGRDKITIEKLRKHCYQGSAIIINFLWEPPKRKRFLWTNSEYIGHYALVIGATPKFFYVVNLFEGETVSKVCDKKLAYWLRPQQRDLYYPVGWIVNAEKNTQID